MKSRCCLVVALFALWAGPAPAQDRKFEVVVCVHGGSWNSGSRHDLDKTVEGLAARGYVAVTVEYRLAPQAAFPAQVEDCKAAVRWLRANAAAYHVNPDRIGAV